jgi:hypothetical protein
MSSGLGTRTSAIDQTFHCNDPKPEAVVKPSNKHSVTLSLKATLLQSNAAFDSIAEIVTRMPNIIWITGNDFQT